MFIGNDNSSGTAVIKNDDSSGNGKSLAPFVRHIPTIAQSNFVAIGRFSTYNLRREYCSSIYLHFGCPACGLRMQCFVPIIDVCTCGSADYGAESLTIRTFDKELQTRRQAYAAEAHGEAEAGA